MPVLGAEWGHRRGHRRLRPGKGPARPAAHQHVHPGEPGPVFGVGLLGGRPPAGGEGGRQEPPPCTVRGARGAPVCYSPPSPQLQNCPREGPSQGRDPRSQPNGPHVASRRQIETTSVLENGPAAAESLGNPDEGPPDNFKRSKPFWLTDDLGGVGGLTETPQIITRRHRACAETCSVTVLELHHHRDQQRNHGDRGTWAESRVSG